MVECEGLIILVVGRGGIFPPDRVFCASDGIPQVTRLEHFRWYPYLMTRASVSLTALTVRVGAKLTHDRRKLDVIHRSRLRSISLEILTILKITMLAMLACGPPGTPYNPAACCQRERKAYWFAESKHQGIRLVSVSPLA